MKTKANETLLARNEERNRIRNWVGMAIVVKACKRINLSFRQMMRKRKRLELEDKMKRRLCGFFLKKLYR